MRHDKLKYDRYLERLRDEIGGRVVSTTSGMRTLQARISVVQTQALIGAPAMVLGLDAAYDRNATRMGAFEVYLISHLRHPPQCMTLFSKLWTRRWPSVPVLASQDLAEVFENSIR